MYWTIAWPEEPGYYWFYGWCFRDRSREPELHFVRVRKIVNGVVRITDGHFLYKQEGAYGMWTKIKFPDLPPLPPEDMVVAPNYTYHTREGGAK